MVQIEKDISDIQNELEEQLRQKESNLSEQMFTEGINSDVLPSEKRKQDSEQEYITF